MAIVTGELVRCGKCGFVGGDVEFRQGPDAEACPNCGAARERLEDVGEPIVDGAVVDTMIQEELAEAGVEATPNAVRDVWCQALESNEVRELIRSEIRVYQEHH